ncbi:MAG TPA: hypothetical protein VN620_01215, partial [Candidatus Methylomirabilis sp.]|nr:hypothetical protein [Candidatus Methylomirabilis sp.]
EEGARKGRSQARQKGREESGAQTGGQKSREESGAQECYQEDKSSCKTHGQAVNSARPVISSHRLD